jgi:hypothetical protein
LECKITETIGIILDNIKTSIDEYLKCINLINILGNDNEMKKVFEEIIIDLFDDFSVLSTILKWVYNILHYVEKIIDINDNNLSKITNVFLCAFNMQGEGSENENPNANFLLGALLNFNNMDTDGIKDFLKNIWEFMCGTEYEESDAYKVFSLFFEGVLWVSGAVVAWMGWMSKSDAAVGIGAKKGADSVLGFLISIVLTIVSDAIWFYSKSNSFTYVEKIGLYIVNVLLFIASGVSCISSLMVPNGDEFLAPISLSLWGLSVLIFEIDFIVFIYNLYTNLDEIVDETWPEKDYSFECLNDINNDHKYYISLELISFKNLLSEEVSLTYDSGASENSVRNRKYPDITLERIFIGNLVYTFGTKPIDIGMEPGAFVDYSILEDSDEGIY